jgi:hypothetical protein
MPVYLFKITITKKKTKKNNNQFKINKIEKEKFNKVK